MKLIQVFLIISLIFCLLNGSYPMLFKKKAEPNKTEPDKSISNPQQTKVNDEVMEAQAPVEGTKSRSKKKAVEKDAKSKNVFKAAWSFCKKRLNKMKILLRLDALLKLARKVRKKQTLSGDDSIPENFQVILPKDVTCTSLVNLVEVLEDRIKTIEESENGETEMETDEEQEEIESLEVCESFILQDRNPLTSEIVRPGDAIISVAINDARSPNISPAVYTSEECKTEVEEHRTTDANRSHLPDKLVGTDAIPASHNTHQLRSVSDTNIQPVPPNSDIKFAENEPIAGSHEHPDTSLQQTTISPSSPAKAVPNKLPVDLNTGNALKTKNENNPKPFTSSLKESPSGLPDPRHSQHLSVDSNRPEAIVQVSEFSHEASNIGESHHTSTETSSISSSPTDENGGRKRKYEPYDDTVPKTPDTPVDHHPTNEINKIPKGGSIIVDETHRAPKSAPPSPKRANQILREGSNIALDPPLTLEAVSPGDTIFNETINDARSISVEDDSKIAEAIDFMTPIRVHIPKLEATVDTPDISETQSSEAPNRKELHEMATDKCVPTISDSPTGEGKGREKRDYKTHYDKDRESSLEAKGIVASSHGNNDLEKEETICYQPASLLNLKVDIQEHPGKELDLLCEKIEQFNANTVPTDDGQLQELFSKYAICVHIKHLPYPNTDFECRFIQAVQIFRTKLGPIKFLNNLYGVLNDIVIQHLAKLKSHNLQTVVEQYRNVHAEEFHKLWDALIFWVDYFCDQEEIRMQMHMDEIIEAIFGVYRLLRYHGNILRPEDKRHKDKQYLEKVAKFWQISNTSHFLFEQLEGIQINNRQRDNASQIEEFVTAMNIVYIMCKYKLPKLIKQNESTEKIATLTIVLFAHHLFIKKLKFDIYVFSTCEMLLTSSKIEIKPIVDENVFGEGLQFLMGNVEERLTENEPEYMAAVLTISCLAAANKEEPFVTSDASQQIRLEIFAKLVEREKLKIKSDCLLVPEISDENIYATVQSLRTDKVVTQTQEDIIEMKKGLIWIRAAINGIHRIDEKTKDVLNIICGIAENSTILDKNNFPALISQADNPHWKEIKKAVGELRKFIKEKEKEEEKRIAKEEKEKGKTIAREGKQLAKQGKQLAKEEKRKLKGAA